MKFYLNCEYVPVASAFIEEYLPKANAVFVKIYLYALNLAAKGEEVEFLAIARALNLLESDVVQCFEYWKEEGIVEFSGKDIFFKAITSGKENQASTAPLQQQEPPQKKTSSSGPSYAPGEVARAISENSMLSETFLLAQEILGKPLNPSDTETLYWFFDGLKFSPEVILMLLEYCVSKEKRRMNYIEKVALSWHEHGITTIEAADDYIQKENERSGHIYSIRKALGIIDRALSPSEEQFINRWSEMYKMDESMISYAYDQCILQTAKLSFPYMDKILERWYKEGIHTVEQAEHDNKVFKSSHENRSNPEKNFDIYSDDYDHEALEALTRKKRD